MLAVCALVRAAAAATLPAGFTETVVSGLSSPTAMDIAPDGRVFICEQGGALRIVKNGALLATPFLTLSTTASGERGLLGIALDPGFASNGFLYLYYTVPVAPVHNRVSRFTANGDVAAAGSEVVILELENLSGATNHNGGAIHFGPDGKLYVAVGENANPSNSQTLANRLGKLLRINSDGSIPSDNPFSGAASGANRAIWALGLRNPFTFAFQRGSGRMYINDVGAGAFEEVDEGIAGANYGWPATEGPFDPNAFPQYRNPVFAYPHSGSFTGCAIAGGAFYDPDSLTFPPAYHGAYFFADLCGGWIRRFHPSAPGTSLEFASGIANPVDLRVHTDGSLYYLAYGNGRLGRIQAARTVSVDDRTVAESAAQAAAFRVSLSSASAEAVSVAYATADGTALAGSDYVATSGTLTFTPGRVVHSVAVPILSDGVAEGVETFALSLSAPSGAALGRAAATGTIEPPPAPADAPMYRAYNPNASYHFFTTSLGEFDNAVAAGYRDESNPPCCAIPFKVPDLAGTGRSAVHRMYNPNNGRHYYTANSGERDGLMGIGWVYEKDEGFVYNSQQPGTAELFKLYNNISGVHLYTVKPEERAAILAQFPGIWFQHTSLGFAVP